MAPTQSSHKTVMASAQRNFTEDEKGIMNEVQKRYEDARNFHFKRIGNKFERGNTYMVEFDTNELEKTFSWYFVYVDTSGYQLLDDGEEAVVYMQTLLEKRRSFLQRLNDFDFLDVVGALIALPITIAFVYITVTANGNENAVSKEFLAIVSLILGYYFGRNK